MTTAIGGHAIGTVGVQSVVVPPDIPPWSGVPPVRGANATFEIASAANAGTWLRVPPVLTVTAPTATYTHHRLTTTWTYASPVSKPQAWYRVQIVAREEPLGTQMFGAGAFGGSTVLFDSGQIVGTAGSYHAPLTMRDAERYVVRVTVSDGTDSTTVGQAFTVAVVYVDVDVDSFDGAAAVDAPIAENSGTSGEQRLHLASIDGAYPVPAPSVSRVASAWSPGYTFPWVDFVTHWPQRNNVTGGRAQVTTSRAVYVSLDERVSVRTTDLATPYFAVGP